MVEFVPAAHSAAVVSKTISRLVHDSFLCYYYEMKIGELDGSNIEIAWSILNNVDMHDMFAKSITHRLTFANCIDPHPASGRGPRSQNPNDRRRHLGKNGS
jgi:hypothetical protein